MVIKNKVAVVVVVAIVFLTVNSHLLWRKKKSVFLKTSQTVHHCEACLFYSKGCYDILENNE